MDRRAALRELEAVGMTTTDAETALDKALTRYPAGIEQMLHHSTQFSDKGIMRLYGEDAGSVVLILRRAWLR